MKKSILNFGWIVLLALPLVLASCNKDDDPVPTPTTRTRAKLSIVDRLLLHDEQFSTLVSALQRVNLVSVLEGDGPFTVFAPTNDAFTAWELI